MCSTPFNTCHIIFVTLWVLGELFMQLRTIANPFTLANKQAQTKETAHKQNPLRLLFSHAQHGGHKVKIWKRDPAVKEIGIRTSFIHTPIQAGPQDDEIVIQGMPKVSPDKDGNFLFDPSKQSKEFDAVHTFAVVRQVMTGMQRSLKRMGVKTDFNWQWGKTNPINVFPHAGETPNAYYSRREKAMKFFFFNAPQGPLKGQKIYTNRSFDIVSHETGHAVLDGLKPGFLSSWHPQTGGIHESFGDLMSIFTMLSQLDQCETIVAESKGNLHDKSFINSVAKEFGDALGRPWGLRNAANDLKLSDVTNEVHDISQVMTGAVYAVLADMFEANLNLDQEDPAMTLFKTGEHLQSLVLKALIDSPDKNATFKDVAENMIRLESNPAFKEIIRKSFTEREILGVSIKAENKGITPGKLNFDKTCGTLQLPEFQTEINAAIDQAIKLNLKG